jgi:Domain of unknown function (DUF4157)/Lysine-specific metallo-endopeptidase
VLQRCGKMSGPSCPCHTAERHQKSDQLLTARSALSEQPIAAPPIVHDVLRSPGQPLDPSARARMEARFGHDFSQVRVHADAQASDSARAVNARAYTVGRHVAFASGEYAPGSIEGQQLLTHELTHVVQQGAPTGTVDTPVMRQEKPVPPSYSGCQPAQQALLDATVKDARTKINAAASVVASAYGRPGSVTAVNKALLMTHFHTTDRDDMRRILGTYHSIGRAFDAGLKLQCEQTCPSTATTMDCGYAYNTQLFGGFGPIHICFAPPPGCNFTTTPAYKRIALVIHEAAHRHAGIDDRVYIWQLQAYAAQSAKEAMDNADSYGYFAALV